MEIDLEGVLLITETTGQDRARGVLCSAVKEDHDVMWNPARSFVNAILRKTSKPVILIVLPVWWERYFGLVLGGAADLTADGRRRSRKGQGRQAAARGPDVSSLPSALFGTCRRRHPSWLYPPRHGIGVRGHGEEEPFSLWFCPVRKLMLSAGPLFMLRFSWSASFAQLGSSPSSGSGNYRSNRRCRFVGVDFARLASTSACPRLQM